MVVSGLRERLLRVAARRPHVLLVTAPGRERLRWAAEAWLAAAGWPRALSPADADVLLVAGEAGEAGEELRQVVDRVAAGVPAPLVRTQARRAGDLDDVLRAAQRRLADGGDRPDRVGLPEEPGMADRGDDRDGLRLDVLHLPLGPVLPAWPAGLVLDVALQGDVVQEATPRLLPAVEDGWSGDVAPARLAAARDLDLAADVLHLAGAGALASRAARLRDGLVAPAPDADLPGRVRALAARVGGARLLAAALRGTPTAGDGGNVATMLADRLADRLAAAAAGAERGRGPTPAFWSDEAVAGRMHALPAALPGGELTAVRLAVAAAGLRDVAGAVARAGDREPARA